MRALTEAEGRVIAVLLGGAGESERERLRRVRVPRSTYHAARRRAYEEGWLRDRYVPDPVRFGLRWVSFLIARPFADRGEALIQRWKEEAGNVVISASPQTALGVFFHASEKGAARLRDEVASARLASTLTGVTARVSGPEVPVYFDYEGLWTHLAEIPGAASYPNGLGGSFAESDDEPPPLTSHQRWAATELIHRPFVAEAQGRGGHLVGPLGLPFSQVKMLRQGWVTHRVFLEPSVLPPYRGRAADEVVFVLGDFRPGVRPEALFATLTRECRVFPFLYATHAGRLLIGALGRGGPLPAEEMPRAEPARRPVMPTLQAALEGIEIVEEAAARFSPVVDHRYDRILPAARPS